MTLLLLLGGTGTRSKVRLVLNYGENNDKPDDFLWRRTVAPWTQDALVLDQVAQTVTRTNNLGWTRGYPDTAILGGGKQIVLWADSWQAALLASKGYTLIPDGSSDVPIGG
jgi:hypothetical protein